MVDAQQISSRMTDLARQGRFEELRAVAMKTYLDYRDQDQVLASTAARHVVRAFLEETETLAQLKVETLDRAEEMLADFTDSTDVEVIGNVAIAKINILNYKLRSLHADSAALELAELAKKCAVYPHPWVATRSLSALQELVEFYCDQGDWQLAVAVSVEVCGLAYREGSPKLAVPVDEFLLDLMAELEAMWITGNVTELIRVTDVTEIYQAYTEVAELVMAFGDPASSTEALVKLAAMQYRAYGSVHPELVLQLYDRWHILEEQALPDVLQEAATVLWDAGYGCVEQLNEALALGHDTGLHLRRLAVGWEPEVDVAYLAGKVPVKRIVEAAVAGCSTSELRAKVAQQLQPFTTNRLELAPLLGCE